MAPLEYLSRAGRVRGIHSFHGDPRLRASRPAQRGDVPPAIRQGARGRCRGEASRKVVAPPQTGFITPAHLAGIAETAPPAREDTARLRLARHALPSQGAWIDRSYP